MENSYSFITLILGVGVDTIHIPTVKRFYREDDRLMLDNFLTDAEREHIERLSDEIIPEVAAGIFAARQAVVTALKNGGLYGFDPANVEILPDDEGSPRVNLSGDALEGFSDIGGAAFHVTISNEDDHAVALAVLEGGQ